MTVATPGADDADDAARGPGGPVLHGVPAVGGVAVGRLIRADAPPAPTPPGAVPDPTDVVAAFAAVAAELDALADSLRGRGRGDEAEIVEVGALIAADPTLVQFARQSVADGRTAAEAVVAACDRHADVLAALGDPLFADRAADVRQIGRRAAEVLRGVRRPRTADAVVVGVELAAADLLMPEPPPIGAVSARGGPTGHLAVVARALGLPLVLGVDLAPLRAAEGCRVLVDGYRGLVVIDPAVRDVVPDLAVTRRQPRAGQGTRPTTTRDGRRVGVWANVGGYREAATARARGAEGIGLLRTELPFLTADHWPDEDEFAAALVPLLRDGPPGPAVVRTLDLTGDKRPAFAGQARRPQHEDARLGTQFLGILLAARTAARPVRILVPMVEDATDFARCRHVLSGACRSLGVPHPPLGAMVELPGAVADAEPIAATADFLSLGTNDLTAALLGRPRHDPALLPRAAAEPAVLRAVDGIVRAGHRFGRQVSVCGDAGADPRVLPLFVGLDIDVLSVAPPALDAVRAQVRNLDHARCAELARTRMAG